MANNSALDEILARYQKSFSAKVYSDENDDHDLLMDVFGLTPELKRENRQYWGRELGMCWELLVTEVCKYCTGFGPGLRFGSDEPCDMVVGKYAIDTKYRIGSGDSGTLKKFKEYGPLLRDRKYEPVFLILREDNLHAAITACRAGGWEVFIGNSSFDFIERTSGYDLKSFLRGRAGAFPVIR